MLLFLELSNSSGNELDGVNVYFFSVLIILLSFYISMSITLYKLG